MSSEDAYRNRYLERVTELRSKLPELTLLCHELGGADGVKSVSWRIKSWESVLEKLRRRYLQGRSHYTVDHILDILGIRITINNPASANALRSALAARFQIDGNITSQNHQSIKIEDENFPFYYSHHLIGHPREDDELFHGLGHFEIQIVSLASEAVFEAIHAALYKTSSAKDKPRQTEPAPAAKRFNRRNALELLDYLSGAINGLTALIDKPGVHEKNDIHPYLAQFGFILSPGPDTLLSEVPIGLGTQFRIDFLVREPPADYILVEIENPRHKLFTNSGNPTSALTHAVQQVEDWQEWIEQNISTMQRTHPDIISPRGVVIIGRSKGLSDQDRVRLARRNINTRGKLSILTYDDVIAKATAYVNSLSKMMTTSS